MHLPLHRVDLTLAYSHGEYIEWCDRLLDARIDLVDIESILYHSLNSVLKGVDISLIVAHCLDACPRLRDLEELSLEEKVIPPSVELDNFIRNMTHRLNKFIGRYVIVGTTANENNFTISLQVSIISTELGLLR